MTPSQATTTGGPGVDEAVDSALDRWLGLIIAAGVILVFLLAILITIVVVAKRRKLRYVHREVPTAYNRLSDRSSGIGSSIEELAGDPYSIYFIPTGQKGGTDPFQWRKAREGMAPNEEKTMSIEKVKHPNV